jgi:hypothetical protein
MNIPRRLRDVYRFPGFVPSASVRGFPGDDGAIIVALRRRRKKHAAANADKYCGASTINVHASFAISRAATNASTSV